MSHELWSSKDDQGDTDVEEDVMDLGRVAHITYVRNLQKDFNVFKNNVEAIYIHQNPILTTPRSINITNLWFRWSRQLNFS